MAKLSADGKFVTVEKGDTLSEIAQQYAGGASKYKQLAALNDIRNPDLIYVGQKVSLYEKSSSTTSTTSNKVTISQFGIQSDAENELLVTWSWSKSGYTANYEVWWEYTTSASVWFTGNKATTENRYSTYQIPDRAKQVRVRIKPISKTYKSNGKDATYFAGAYTDATKCVYDVVDKPGIPSGLNVTIDDLTLAAKLDNLDDKVSLVNFEVVKDNSTVYKTSKEKTSTNSVSYSTSVVAGGEYKVRCRAYSDGVYGDWSDYSSNITTRPANPATPTKCEARSESSIYVEWASVGGAETYTLEYAQTKTDFDTNDNPKSITGITNPYREVTGLESGNEYFFRVKAVNDKGESEWSEIISTAIGTGPVAPTTWSSTTTAISGDDETVSLYWVHNTEDNSSQSYAEVELTIDGVSNVNSVANDVSVEIGTISSTTVNGNKITYRVDNSTDKKEKDKTHSLTIQTKNYGEGAAIKWRVRTAGITNVQGEWSIERTVNIYNMPSLDLRVTNSSGNMFDILTAFPFYISASVGSINTDLQRPIGYHITISAGESYDTLDMVGNPKRVNAGDLVYSGHFNHSYSSLEPLTAEFTPGDVSLENGVLYTLTCLASMSSGITISAEHTFTTSWADSKYEPNAEVSVDTDNFSASVRPYCATYRTVYYKVVYSAGTYKTTAETIDGVYGEPVNSTFTTTGEQVYYGTTATGEDTYFCEVEESTLNIGVTFSVYRREFDGSFTELATGLDGDANTFITDPHPGLDYARYRIVAIDKTTGAVSYYDLPNYPVGGKAIIIQWDEEWKAFDAFTGEDTITEPTWSGSLLKLPYNVDVSDNHTTDVSLVKYIGRKHPVSYYGTQVETTSTWNVEIERKDEETLYALRRLAAWTGDVYVREPSGSGYWANIAVSFSQKHCEPTIPVTMDITRVEGGM